MARSGGPTGLANRSVTLAELKDTLRRAWDAETSSDPAHWSPSNPAWGQCAVTALIVQDHFGGELLRGTVGEIPHYWNLLPSRQTVDLTLHQFGRESPPVVEIEPRSREYVIAFPDTVSRYRHLQSKVSALLDGAF